MNIEQVKISEVLPNKDNPRNITDEKMDKLIKSIKEFPSMLKIRPIVVDSEMIVLGGNMRLEACKKAGLDSVYIIKADDLTEEQKKEFIIKDNAGFGTWNWEMLQDEWDLSDLENWGLDLPDFFEEEAEDTIGDDDAPEAPEIPETVLGDLWELGDHRLLCGDSTSVDDVEKLMDGHKADMVFSDPPYGMCLDADYSGAKSSLSFAGEKGVLGGKKYRNVIGDHDDFKPELITTFFDNFSYCKEMFLWGADYYAEYLMGKNQGSWVVWDKRLDESADKMYGSTFELCWSKAKHKRMLARVKWAGIFGTEKEFDHKRHHPTQKPVALVDWFFDYYSLQDKKTVVDLYGGSGSTLVSSEKNKKRCFCMELDPLYCDVIVKRYIDFCRKNNRPFTVKLNGEEYKGELLNE